MPADTPVPTITDLLADADRLLSPEQAARVLAVDVGTMRVWRCTRRYPIPFAKIGKAVRYRAGDLAKYIESRMVSPLAEIRA